ncbi:MAG: hypothetical protein K0Q77_1725 [Anaerosporomusa subterranea]|jgi:hypothetical protein|nr:hypothetical protein [Anaerosporomusa subterranea]
MATFTKVNNQDGGFIVSFLLLLIALAAVLAVAVWLFLLRQGDAEFMFLTDSRTEFTLQEITQDKAVFVSQVPFVNRGTQDGTLVDVFPRHLLPVEYFDSVNVAAKITIASQPRKDDYWEAVIIESGKGDAVILTVILTAKNGDIVSSLSEMVDMPIDIVYQVVARCNSYLHKSRLVMRAEEIAAAMAEVSAKGGVAK